ncbi:MAG: hypothetical protein JXX14_09715 [Deltaproteobacteria bacterium]|nr:hypothetical protein [Deltaproteobacteria bacterium]
MKFVTIIRWPNPSLKENDTVPLNCQKCGTANEDGGKFCAACGSPLAAAPVAKAVPVAGSGGVRAKTMLFNKAPEVASAPPAAAGPRNIPQGTMLGAPAVQLPKQQLAGQNAPQKSAPPAAKPAPIVSAPMANVATSKPAPAATSAKRTDIAGAAPPVAGERARTVIGLPAANAGDVAAAIDAAKKATAEARQHAPMSKVALTPQPEQPAPTAAAEHRHVSPANPSPPQASVPPGPGQAISNAPAARAAAKVPSTPPEASMSDEWPDAPAQPRKTSLGIVIPIAVAAVVIAGLVAFILFKFVFAATPRFQPQILASQDGETLTVVLDLPDVAPGTTVRFNDQSMPVAGGKVQFLLQKKQMVLGANLVKITLIEPNGTPEEISFPIMLRHVATNALSKLTDKTPSIDVRFQIAEGFSIKVNGSPCPLENGTCIFNLAVDVNPARGQNAKTLQYAIPFELIDSDGHADPGQHIVVVPVTRFQIDRPAENAVVATSEVTVSGSTVPGATVTINEKQVKAGDVGFSTTVPLPQTGVNKISITVAAADSAPNTTVINVTRVDDLAPYVKSWSADMDAAFNFAKLSRETDTHAGKKIHLSGRIININTERGVTAFLMYVNKGCPQGGQCGVYVVFRGETDAGLQSMVDVYGTVRGTHEIDFAGGAKKTLPAIDAVYVVPVDPSGQ